MGSPERFHGKQLPAVVARLMRGELEAQSEQSAGRSDQTSLTQRRSEILRIDLYVLGSLPFKRLLK